MLNSTDVFVIGGGPAGLAAAIAARQRGFRVMVADGAVPPIDKPCGEGLMPDGISALERLGITVKAQDSYLLRGIQFLRAGLAVGARSLVRVRPRRTAHDPSSNHDRASCRVGG